MSIMDTKKKKRTKTWFNFYKKNMILKENPKYFKKIVNLKLKETT